MSDDPEGPPRLRTHCRMDQGDFRKDFDAVRFPCGYGLMEGSVILSQFRGHWFVVGIRAAVIDAISALILISEVAKEGPEDGFTKLMAMVGHPAILLWHFVPTIQKAYDDLGLNQQIWVTNSTGNPILPEPGYRTPVPVELPMPGMMASVSHEPPAKILLLR